MSIEEILIACCLSLCGHSIQCIAYTLILLMMFAALLAHFHKLGLHTCGYSCLKASLFALSSDYLQLSQFWFHRPFFASFLFFSPSLLSPSFSPSSSLLSSSSSSSSVFFPHSILLFILLPCSSFPTLFPSSSPSFSLALPSSPPLHSLLVLFFILFFLFLVLKQFLWHQNILFWLEANYRLKVLKGGSVKPENKDCSCIRKPLKCTRVTRLLPPWSYPINKEC